MIVPKIRIIDEFDHMPLLCREPGIEQQQESFPNNLEKTLGGMG
jgi:hypothetical protein